MKTSFVLSLLIVTQTLSWGGGNSSIADITEVTEISIDEDKITIRGNGHLEGRVVSPAGAHATSTVFGRPAQVVKMVAEDVTFEVVPYFGRDDVKGVPTGGHDSDELKKMSDQIWKKSIEKAKTIAVGDRVKIGFQGDRITYSGFRLSHVVGYGSMTVHKKADDVKPEAIRDALQELQLIKEWKDGKLPKEKWPKVVADLKPVRVYGDRANAVVVLSEKSGVEKGYYVYHPLSSYSPGNGGGWTYESVAPDVWEYSRRQ